MVVFAGRLGFLAAAGLVLVGLLPTACGSLPSNPGFPPTSTLESTIGTSASRSTSITSGPGDWLGTTSTTLLFPSQKLFMQELSGNGYQTAIVFVDQAGGKTFTVVWIGLDPHKVTRAGHSAIFDQAVALAKKYGAAESTGGRLRVGLFDETVSGLIRDHIVASRDFSLSGGQGQEPGFVGFLHLGAGV